MQHQAGIVYSMDYRGIYSNNVRKNPEHAVRYLIPIAPHTFAPHRRTRSSRSPYMVSHKAFTKSQDFSPFTQTFLLIKLFGKFCQVVRYGLKDFTPTHNVPSASPGPKTGSISSKPTRFQVDFTRDTPARLRALQAQ